MTGVDHSGRHALVVHGGAWDIPRDEHDAHVRGVREALELGETLLRDGAPALDVVVACARLLEDDETYDAGRGSHLNRDGVCELDALLMDGTGLRAGAVAGVSRIRNPIDAARLVLERSPHVILVAQGAERFFESQGGRLVDPGELVVPREAARHARGDAGAGSTVGAVARDRRGRVAVATSTGGTMAKHPGRIGDSPLPGCGGYADDAHGAAGSTGHGEAIIRVVLAKGVVDAMARGASPRAAAERGIQDLALRTGSRAGCIAVAPSGAVGWAHGTPHMAVAACWHDASGALRRHTGLS